MLKKTEVCPFKTNTLSNDLRWRKLSLISLALLMMPMLTHADGPPDWNTLSVVESKSKMTADEAVMYAFQRSPEISKALSQINKGKAQVDEVKSAYFPQVGMSASYGRAGEATLGPKLTQLLYDFGKTSNSVDSQQNLTDSYRKELLKNMTSVAANTLLSYSSVKRYSGLIKVAEDSIDSLGQVRDMAKLRVDAGLNPQSDILQAETRIALLKTTLQQYRTQLNTAQANLATLTGQNATDLAELPDNLRQITLKPDAINYSEIASMQSALAKQKAAEASVAQQKAQHLPDISVEAARLRQFDNNDAYWNNQFALSVSVPIYQGGAVSARVNQAEQDVLAARSDVNQVKLTVDQQASAAFANWSGASAREQLSVRQIEIADRTRSLYRDEYKLSQRSLNDLLSVEQDVYQANSGNVLAHFDVQDAAINYAVAIDNLLPLLGVDKTAEKELPSIQ
ncbi:TolC family outer membrane protein [Serratia sp. UGAL515B_01]|uniref:TolC family outer membrane protein n=1 Tax=Serratia sp. UGAL515B_01 TaxID=2986763 RepID=UPI002954ADC4|nr:TolC family outer membrane protein [Serratia sp. UGAL515B_01]WON77521.1 TolC family outer membrane protein [Serratia sp. UGAL515B_01]